MVRHMCRYMWDTGMAINTRTQVFGMLQAVGVWATVSVSGSSRKACSAYRCHRPLLAGGCCCSDLPPVSSSDAPEYT